jgi:branched-chain amino acid transport system permease protein
MAYLASAPSKRFDPGWIRKLAWLLGSALLLSLPAFVSDYRLFQIELIATTSIIAAGLVVVTGIAGQVSLAQAAFAALGAYGSAVLAQRAGVPQWAGIPLIAALAGACGFVLGLLTLRVEGHNLALATMALTAIVQVVIVHWESLTGGALGLAVPVLQVGSKKLTSAAALYYLIIPLTVIVFALTANLLDSRTGRAFAALRQAEIAARCVGVNVLYYKAVAFAVSAVLGAIGGGLQALQTTYLDPQAFGILDSVVLIAIVVVGGFRTIGGAVLGSAVFVVIPTLLGLFQTYKGFIFAALLLVIIVLFPSGLAGAISAAVAQVRARMAGTGQ